MPRHDELSLLCKLMVRLDELSFVIITAQETVGSAVPAIEEDAYDDFAKPIDPHRLQIILERMVEHHDSRHEMVALRCRLVNGAIQANLAEQCETTSIHAQPTNVESLINGEIGQGFVSLDQLVIELRVKSYAVEVRRDGHRIDQTDVKLHGGGGTRRAFSGRRDASKISICIGVRISATPSRKLAFSASKRSRISPLN
jgi:FixJ family two-component response regulator